MVLCWRRHGRAGGCQIIYGGVAQLGEHLPCKQGVKSSNLSISIWCSYEGALRKADAFLSHGVPRLYNHIKNCLWTQVFNTVFHMIVHASGYITYVPWKPHIEIYLDRVFIRQSIKTTSRHPRCYILWCNQTKLVKVTVTYGEITNLRPEIQRYVSWE